MLYDTIHRIILLTVKKAYRKNVLLTVERMNRLLRYYLVHFERKTYCQSNSTYMIKNSVFFMKHNNILSSIRP